MLSLLVLTLGASFKASPPVGEKEADRETAANEADSLALVAFYHGTTGQRWINNTNWLTGPVDTWYGVTVADGRVTRLELGANGLSRVSGGAGIPPEIGELTQGPAGP